MSAKLRKVSKKDSFTVFDDSQHVEETQRKIMVDVEIQTSLFLEEMSTMTNLKLKPDDDENYQLNDEESKEMDYYKKGCEYFKALRDHFQDKKEKTKERTFVNHLEIQKLKAEYEELFEKYASILEKKHPEEE